VSSLWFQIIKIQNKEYSTNMHASIEDKGDDDTKNSFYEELACLQCDIFIFIHASWN
jgi:hypothetical protein